MKREELIKIIVFTFLEHNHKWVSANRISKESNLELRIIIDFLQNSDLVVKAKTKNSRGETLYSLNEFAKSKYKIEKRDIKLIFEGVRKILLEGKISHGIDSFFILIKENSSWIPKLLIDVYQEKILNLQNRFFELETSFVLKKNRFIRNSF